MKQMIWSISVNGGKRGRERVDNDDDGNDNDDRDDRYDGCSAGAGDDCDEQNRPTFSKNDNNVSGLHADRFPEPISADHLLVVTNYTFALAFALEFAFFHPLWHTKVLKH